MTKKVKDRSKANRLFTENEVEVFYLMGRFQRLVSPDDKDIRQVVEYGQARFSELQSLALENLYNKINAEVEEMSTYIAELEISSGVAKFADED